MVHEYMAWQVFDLPKLIVHINYGSYKESQLYAIDFNAFAIVLRAMSTSF